MKNTHVSVICFLTVCLAIACGERRPAADGGNGSGAPDGGEPACYSDPKTHVEIINACTDEEKVDKSVSLPLLEADGSLPPLP